MFEYPIDYKLMCVLFTGAFWVSPRPQPSDTNRGPSDTPGGGGGEREEMGTPKTPIWNRNDTKT